MHQSSFRPIPLFHFLLHDPLRLLFSRFTARFPGMTGSDPFYAGSLTDAMPGLVAKTSSDAQANPASTAGVGKALQSR